eukprot:3861220-Pleurochrysis_carterae.AAC.2
MNAPDPSNKQFRSPWAIQHITVWRRRQVCLLAYKLLRCTSALSACDACTAIQAHSNRPVLAFHAEDAKLETDTKASETFNVEHARHASEAIYFTYSSGTYDRMASGCIRTDDGWLENEHDNQLTLAAKHAQNIQRQSRTSTYLN